MGQNSEQSEQPSISPIQSDKVIFQRTINAFERKIYSKIRDEEKATGIDTDLSDVAKALEEILEKEAEVEETAQNDKRKVHSTKVAEMRNGALENLGGTQKRQRKDEVENETVEKNKCRSGGDTVAYLRDKNDFMQKWKLKKCGYRGSD